MSSLSKTEYEAIFSEAEQFYAADNLERASEKYLILAGNTPLAGLAYYRLATISNRAGDPYVAKGLYNKAFSYMPNICTILLSEGHPNRGYVFPGLKQEELQEGCPFCGKGGQPYWCYSMVELGAAYVQAFNPVRVWMYCGDCHHLYAEEFPAQSPPPANVDLSKSKAVGMQTEINILPFYSDLLAKLGALAPGKQLLEIGVGGSACALVAQEMGFDMYGIDISEGNVVQARRYGLNVDLADFMAFETDRKWDIIIMGDVIEHVSDPVKAMEKVSGLLKDGGVLWLSTPNFEASYTKILGHSDPMRRIANHKNYFSRKSLYSLLGRFGFEPSGYRVSAHWGGSMEVVATRS